MSTTEVPNAIFSIFAATKASVSMGSNMYGQSAGNLPSLVPGYESWGANRPNHSF
ncbi:MAG: hypothetical protein ACJ708_02425 [Nitrososphaeraceae archaeon]